MNHISFKQLFIIGIGSIGIGRAKDRCVLFILNQKIDKCSHDALRQITTCQCADRAHAMIRVDLDYHKAEGLPELPEFGVLMPIKSHFSDLDYYGRGSSANYPDRKDGYKLGYYSSSTIEEFETYLKPQESGNHCDTRYFILRDEKSDHGMIFSCVKEPFNFSALPWSPTQIEAARHPFELPDINYTFVKLSSAMMGVGGDDSWGAPVLEQFKVPNQDLHLSFVFQGF